MNTLLLWIQLATAALVILAFATQLAKSADIIAFKTGLGRSFIGVVLLATATSLPELGTGVSSIVLVGAPDLALGDAFGSNIFNLLIIGILDLLWREGPILRSIGPAASTVGVLGALVVAIAAIAIVFHSSTTLASTWLISPVSIVLFLVFLVALFVIYKSGLSSDHGDSEVDYSENSMLKASLLYLVSAAVVVGAAVWLADLGGQVTEVMGWDASFVGTQFLALSTSLPELAASIAALRLRAPELAITNVLGSNLFNMGFVLFLDDVSYVDGAIWKSVSSIHVFTALMAILMTMVVLIPMVNRTRVSLGRIVTLEATLLISLYVVTSGAVFLVGGVSH